jgi:hypothetical protein
VDQLLVIADEDNLLTAKHRRNYTLCFIIDHGTFHQWIEVNPAQELDVASIDTVLNLSLSGR